MSHPSRVAIVLALALVLVLLLDDAHAGFGGSVARGCELCRMDIEPNDKDLPDGVHQCSDVVPANGQPFFDGTNTNPNCPLVTPADTQSNVSDCHADPYDNRCSHSERLQGTNKYGMLAHYGSFTSNVWVAFILGAALIFVALGYFLLPSLISQQNTTMMINVSRTVGGGGSAGGLATSGLGGSANHIVPDSLWPLPTAADASALRQRQLRQR